MDKSLMRDLLVSAARQGVCSKDVLASIVEGEFAVEVGDVSRSSLRHIYGRRLSRTEAGSPLHSKTQELVSFLEDYSGDTLSMISLSIEGGGYHLFLADSPVTKILFWMRMFSR